MKIDVVDLLLEQLEQYEKELLDIVNRKLEKGTKEYSETLQAYQHLYPRLQAIMIFIRQVIEKAEKENLLKQRHKKKYNSLCNLEGMIKHCIKQNFNES